MAVKRDDDVGAAVIDLSARRLSDPPEPDELDDDPVVPENALVRVDEGLPPDDFALPLEPEVFYPDLEDSGDLERSYGAGAPAGPRGASGVIIEPPVEARRARGPVLVASQDPWAVSILTGRKVDVISSTGIDSALALASQTAPCVMVVSMQLSDGSAFDLLEVLASWHAPFEAIVILRPDQWDYAQACFASGAAEVVEHGDTDQLLSVLASLASIDRSTENRADVHVPISVEVSGYSWSLETIDLRATGIAVVGVPPLEKGTTVRFSLSLLGRRVELRGQLTRSWEDHSMTYGAFRFIGLSPEQREFLRAAVSEYGGHKVEDAVVHAWRREIRTIVGTFDSNRDSAPPSHKNKRSTIVHTHDSVIHRDTGEDGPLEKHPGWITGTIDFAPQEWGERIKQSVMVMLVVIGCIGGAIVVLHMLEWLLTSK